MIDVVLIFVFPAIICVLPFVSLFFVVNRKTLRGSAIGTGLAMLGLTLSNFLTTVLAISLSGYGITRNLPEDQTHCINGVGVFFVSGCFFAVLTFVIGAVYTVRNYRE